MREFVRCGAVELLCMALADAALAQTFDKVFAVNVNVFWLNPARELAVVRQALRPKGRLFLFYEPPAAARLARIGKACRENLHRAGFAVVDMFTMNSGNTRQCIVAQRAAGN